jgi:hypothetical protein
MAREVKQPPTEAAFWQWFRDNADRLHTAIGHDEEAVLSELVTALRRVHRGLTCELGPRDDGSCELVISADGKRDLFPVVRHLVDTAPDVPGWIIIAFRQPKGTQYSISFGTTTLHPDTIWFRLRPEKKGRVGVELYMAGLTSGNRQAFEHAAILLLDAALGEYTVETRIGSITCQPLPVAPEQRGLRIFHDLPHIVSGWTPSA